MSVGQQATSSVIDGQLSTLSVELRNLMQRISNLSTNINGQATGLATLEAMGYNATDAQAALNMISYMNTVAAVYYGTAAQPSAFNFNQELSQLWGGY